MSNKRATKEEIHQVRVAMAIAFPGVFAAPRSNDVRRPLAIGIHVGAAERLREMFPEMSLRMISGGMHDYVNGHKYLTACRAGAGRINLDGETVGYVTDEQAAFAKAKLKAMKSRKRGKPKPKVPTVRSAVAEALAHV